MIYAIIRESLMSAYAAGNISIEQVALVNNWLDLMEGVKD